MNSIFSLFLLILFPCVYGKTIAISFDDFPLPSTEIFSLEERTFRLLSTLEKQKCQAVFFCIGKGCQHPKCYGLLQQIDSHGHFIANHSWLHTHLSSQKLSEFEDELLKTQALLRPFTHAKKWYRFPYLDYGNRKANGGSRKKMKEVFKILKNNEFLEGFVSVNTFDWFLDGALIKAKKEGKDIDYEGLRTLYMELLEEWLEYFNTFFANQVEEKVDHVLLFHANDLNALYLEDIFKLLKKKEWQVVSPEVAFNNYKWREKILANTDLIIKNPTSLDTEYILKCINEHNVFKSLIAP